MKPHLKLYNNGTVRLLTLPRAHFPPYDRLATVGNGPPVFVGSFGLQGNKYRDDGRDGVLRNGQSVPLVGG